MSPDTPFRHFHDQLTVLNRQLLAMSEKAESLVDLSVDANSAWTRARPRR